MKENFVSPVSKHDPLNVQEYHNHTILTGNKGHKYHVNSRGEFQGRASIEEGKIKLIGGLTNDSYKAVRICIDNYDAWFDFIRENATHPLAASYHLALCLTKEDALRFRRNGFVSSMIDKVLDDGPFRVETIKINDDLLDIHKIKSENEGNADIYMRSWKTGEHFLSVDSRPRFESIKDFSNNLQKKVIINGKSIYPVRISYGLAH